MGRRVTHNAGKRRSIYLKPEHEKIAKQIENVSEFFQIALEQAAAIMAFDIIRKQKGLPVAPPPTDNQAAEWNKNHPLDPLTAKRLGKTKNGPTPTVITHNSVIDT